MDLDFNVGEGNEYTQTEHQNFKEINSNLKVAAEGIYAMVEDVKNLSEQAIKGDLSYRADESKHGGEFANIMSGVNRTLDAVIAPIKRGFPQYCRKWLRAIFALPWKAIIKVTMQRSRKRSTRTIKKHQKLYQRDRDRPRGNGETAKS